MNVRLVSAASGVSSALPSTGAQPASLTLTPGSGSTAPSLRTVLV